MNRSWIVTLFVILAFGIVLGWWISGLIDPKKDRVTDQDSTILLEKIEKVTKLVTVEGYFSEIYSYKDYYKFDFWPFRKKALLRVKARITAGIDLNDLKIGAEEEHKKIVIKGNFMSDILYMETDFDYYDLTEGTFNSFSEKDHTELQRKAKDYIRNSARESDLLIQAEEQVKDLIQLLRFMIESSGWTLEIQGNDNLELMK
jgi:hypothetical protein